MTHRVRVLLTSMVLAAGILGLASARPQAPPAPAAKLDRVVFLAGGLGEEELLTFTATVSASGHPGVVLFDSPGAGPYNKAFLAAMRAEQVIPVGSFPDGVPDLERRLGV